MRLEALREGECATLQKIELCGTMRRRLFDLGMIEGTKISVLRKNRCASVLLVRGTMLALRKKDLQKIGVKLCD